REKDGDIVLSQSRYIEQILERHNMLDAKDRATPLAMGTRAAPVTDDEGKLLEDPTPYRALVGELNYLAVSTRPDLAYALSVLSRSMAKPTRAAMSAAKGVLRYLAGTREMGLRFPGGQGLQLDGYSDSDWAGDTVTRRSTTGYVFRGERYCDKLEQPAAAYRGSIISGGRVSSSFQCGERSPLAVKAV
ncbi:hypothetical protein VaNZ11_014802, partial [Volvox africanus]